MPGYEAPVNLVYSQRNRSACIRIPMYSQSPKAKRIEFRCPDPTANPYLAFSAMLMAGLDGIEKGLDPGAPSDFDLFEESHGDIPQVPGSLDEALDALEADHDFLTKGGVFSEDLISTWIDWKRRTRSTSSGSGRIRPSSSSTTTPSGRQRALARDCRAALRPDVRPGPATRCGGALRLRRLPLGARRPRLGPTQYLAGHIPGAVFLDVERDLSAPPGAGGRHPLPAAGDFARAAGAAGIGPDTFVVAYGSLGGAERLWWLLRHFGHDACAVIDLDAWRGPLTAGEEHAEPAVFEPRPRNDDTIELDELAARLGELVVVDARLPRPLPRRAEPDRPRARPDPGALNAPWTEPLPRATRRRARRLLRLGRHRLRHPAPPAPRRPRGTPLPRLLVGVGAARRAPARDGG